MTRVTVFGGSGYLGQRLVYRLAGHGYRPRVAARHAAPDIFGDLPGGVEFARCDIRDPDAVARALDGAAGAVNAVGLYVETRREKFEDVHVRGARRVAQHAAANGLRLVHVSGIGADASSRSRYIRARGQGELAVREADPRAVIVRPGAMFGHGDALLRGLGGLVRALPLIPLFGDGGTRLQPVHVDDVAAAVDRLLSRSGPGPTLYELGGPRIYAYRELLETIASAAGRRRLLVPLPFAAWEALAALASLLPNPPLTRDQVALLRRDNVADCGVAGFADLGIEPATLEEHLASTGNTG